MLYKLKEKLIQEAIEKERKDELKEKLKRKLDEEAKNRDKKYKLKLISSGFIPSNERLIKTKNKIDKELLNPLIQKLIDKLDNEIISHVYKDKKNNNKRKNMRNKFENMTTIKKFKKPKIKIPSMEVMKNLCHYKLYDYLMNNDFKEFIVKNERLEFYEPIKEKDSLEKFQNYLNNKIKINENKKILNEKIYKFIKKEKNKKKKKEEKIKKKWK